ncbi:MAG: PQQ-binding-like beta-propeller repeat protein [Candidatus Helarchaeota archaeon]|nr:PQQ-binding-like beta-propeller repeat protein [Candidatus Helarchaeota archaeon]
MNQRVFLKTLFIMFIFLLFCVGASLGSSAPRTATVPSSVVGLATVPGSSDPSGDEWPMFHGQLNHTGVAQTTLTNGTGPVWSYQIGNIWASSPIVAYGRLFVSGYDSKVYCLNISTGAQLWNTTVSGVIALAVADGSVFGGTSLGYFFCLNATTGQINWTSSIASGAINSPPAIAGGYAYVGCNDYKVYCVSITSHTVIWFNNTGAVLGSPAVVDGRVYVASEGLLVYCLNATNGNIIWYNNTGGEATSSPAIAGGRVYVGSDSDKVYCMNATNGHIIWTYITGDDVASSPAVASGRVYVGSYDSKIYCLNATSGTFLWSYTTGGSVHSSPAVANGRVYVGSSDKKVYCLNAITGTFLWSYTTGGNVLFSPAVTNGHVYIGSQDNKIYCLPLDLLSGNPQQQIPVFTMPFILLGAIIAVGFLTLKRRIEF